MNQDFEVPRLRGLFHSLIFSTIALAPKHTRQSSTFYSTREVSWLFQALRNHPSLASSLKRPAF